jgi:hypothetical protein
MLGGNRIGSLINALMNFMASIILIFHLKFAISSSWS